MKPRKIAFIKESGLSAGGTERWLQMMACGLDPTRYAVDYLYLDGPQVDPSRLQYMRQRGIRLLPWTKDHFWDHFKEEEYDLIQTAKSRGAELPFFRMKKPVVEYRTLAGLPDPAPNTVFSIHLSQWQRTEWFLRGGDLAKSAVIPIPTERPATKDDLRSSLGIPSDAIVAGFHQRRDDAIYSPIPLEAFAKLHAANAYFVIMGGSALYKEQARTLQLANVRFLDHSGDAVTISRFLNTLDIFAHGRNDGETFGTVFAEALIHGKPCLSHRANGGANGHQETMGPAGLFAVNKEDYARYLKELMESPSLRHALAAKATHHAEKYFLAEGAVKHLAAIYDFILDGRPLPESTNSYGRSPLGFFYYGPTEHKEDLAAHVTTRTVPVAYALFLLDQFKSQIAGFLDLSPHQSLLGFALASQHPQGQAYLLDRGQVSTQRLKETIWLNNWESRVHLLRPDELSNPEMRIDGVHIATDGLNLLDKLKLIVEHSMPILFLEGDDNTLTEMLRRNGYLFWDLSSQQMTAGRLALNPHKHGHLIGRMPRLDRQYRRYKMTEQLRKIVYLTLKGLRHPHRALQGLLRYREMPMYGLRF